MFSHKCLSLLWCLYLVIYYISVMQQLGEAALKFPEVQVALIAFVRKVLMGNKAHCEALEKALKCTSGGKLKLKSIYPHLSL